MIYLLLINKLYNKIKLIIFYYDKQKKELLILVIKEEAIDQIYDKGEEYNT